MTKRAWSVALAVSVAAGGLAIAVPGFTGDRGDVATVADLDSPSVVRLCGGRTTGEENVVDEFNTAVDTDAVGGLAREVFRSSYSGLEIVRTECPATLLVFVAGIDEEAKDSFYSGLAELQHVDEERVRLKEVAVGLELLKQAQDTALQVLRRSSSPFSSISYEVRTSVLVIGSAAPLPAGLRQQLESAIDVSIEFKKEPMATLLSGR